MPGVQMVFATGLLEELVSVLAPMVEQGFTHLPLVIVALAIRRCYDSLERAGTSGRPDVWLIVFQRYSEAIPSSSRSLSTSLTLLCFLRIFPRQRTRQPLLEIFFCLFLTPPTPIYTQSTSYEPPSFFHAIDIQIPQ